MSMLLLIISSIIAPMCFVSSFDIKCDSRQARHSYVAVVNTCFPKFMDIKFPAMEITSIIPNNGPATYGALTVVNKTVNYLPRKIENFIPNLSALTVKECHLKSVSKHDFESLTELVYLYLMGNELEELENDLFKFNAKLQYVNFDNNHLKHVGEYFLSQTKFLKNYSFRNNHCTNVTNLSSGVKQLLKQLQRDCPPNEGMINRSTCNNEKLEQQIIALETENKSLKNLTRKIIMFATKRKLNSNCGRVEYNAGYIINGKDVRRGQFPFLAGLFLTSNDVFICGGNIITSKHILTAAHCIQEKNSKRLDPEDIAVTLGRHNFSKNIETGSETRIVNETFVHPSWKPHALRYDSDLAILVVDSEIQFNRFIQPVCVNMHPKVSSYGNGTVVGWGLVERSLNHSKVARMANVQAVTKAECTKNDPILIMSENMFCAGGRGSGPCSGDSGGGFFVFIDGAWHLRGIVSSATLKGNGECDSDRYALYTQLSNFTSWINEIIDIGGDFD